MATLRAQTPPSAQQQQPQQPQSQWIFAPATNPMKATPSRLDGTCQRGLDERLLRAKACRFIFEVGAELRLPQATISCACVMLHRFYMRRSLAQFRQYDVAAGALFLACKVEESLRKYHDIIVKMVRAALKNPAAQVGAQHKEFQRWHEVVLRMEECLMETLCYELEIDLPYGHLPVLWARLTADMPPRTPAIYRPVLSTTMEASASTSGVDPSAVVRLAWLWINDGMRSAACVLFPAPCIALASLLMATAFYGALLNSANSGGGKSAISDTDKSDAIITEQQPFYGDPRMDDSAMAIFSQHCLLSGSAVRGAWREMLAVYELRDLRPTFEAKFEQEQARKRHFGQPVGVEELDVLAVRKFFEWRNGEKMADMPTVCFDPPAEDDVSMDMSEPEDGEVLDD